MVYCSECGKKIGSGVDYFDYYDEPICSDCAVTNSNGEICPSCGKKFPMEHMMSAFCDQCYQECD